MMDRLVVVTNRWLRRMVGLSLFENGKIDNIERREGHVLFVSIGGRIWG